MQTLAYCPHLPAVLERLQQLYARRGLDRVYASFGLPSPALAEFARRTPAGPCAPPDPQERARHWDAVLRQRPAVEDDRVPAAYLSELDQGLYGALCGGEIRFTADPDTGWISSMVPPLLASWDQLDGLDWDRQGPRAQWYERFLKAFAGAASGRFGVSHFILIDGLNFAFELRGATRTYLALSEDPERLRQAIDLAFALNCWVQDRFFETVPLVGGGTCSNMASWLPGRAVSESIDPFHMTSVEYFEKWGVESVERILAHYDGGGIHLHGNGRHLLEAACRIRGLRLLYLADDRGFPRAFDLLPELRRRAGDMPLVVGVPFPDFVQALRRHALVGGCFYVVRDAPDADAARRAMDDVREYRS
ncbi:MAG: hypothetical protein AB1505_15630 [Candidatus Latescibacterota bacterium]